MHTFRVGDQYFESLQSGLRTFDVRRGVQVGDAVRYVEFDHVLWRASGRVLDMVVTYVLPVSEAGAVVFSMRRAGARAAA